MIGVLIVAEHRQGTLRPVTAELVGAAAALKGEGTSATTMAVIGADVERLAEQAAAMGADEILMVTAQEQEFDPDVYRVTVAALIEARSPAVVLVPHTVDGCGYAPALATGGKYGFATDVFGLRFEDGALVATRSAYQEKVHVDLDFPGKSTVILTVRPGAFPTIEGTAAVRRTQYSAPAVAIRSQHHGYVEPEGAGDADVTAATVIVAIGRGVGDRSMVEALGTLAERMGATLACSRPVVDAGWLPKSRQVGQSGRTAANCKLYLAMGISGAVQHLAGMKHVETIIAVNTDPEAPIFGVARYGVVADVSEIAEELQALFE